MHTWYPRIISASLSPNTESEDVWTAVRVLCTPWTWQHGDASSRVESWFSRYHDGAYAVSFDSARSALYGVLSSLSIGKGDEVLLQAFTCVAVPNSVLWTGATPVYVDIDTTYNIDISDLEKKRTVRTKAMIVQHTFGVVADMTAIVSFARKYKLLLIEDCAHSLGATYKGKRVGTFGDAAIFSFGRDKVLSSVWGGMALINSKCQTPNAKGNLQQFHQSLPMPTYGWIFQQVLHPIAFALILSSYRLVVGKVILVLMQKAHLLSLPVRSEEKKGMKPRGLPIKYPNALATLLSVQLAKLSRFTATRTVVASLYATALAKKGYRVDALAQGSSYLRFPLWTLASDRIKKSAKKQGILLGNWYSHIIDPAGTDMRVVGYSMGSCPNAERLATHILNLPTLISQSDAQRVIDLF